MRRDKPEQSKYTAKCAQVSQNMAWRKASSLHLEDFIIYEYFELSQAKPPQVLLV